MSKMEIKRLKPVGNESRDFSPRKKTRIDTPELKFRSFYETFVDVPDISDNFEAIIVDVGKRKKSTGSPSKVVAALHIDF